eukprot:gene7736-911_t
MTTVAPAGGDLPLEVAAPAPSVDQSTSNQPTENVSVPSSTGGSAPVQSAPAVASPSFPTAFPTNFPTTSAEKPVEKPVMSLDYDDQDCSAFECNICLDLAKEPVVTLCGHLFCWPCLYRWIQVQHLSKACPVCKAGVVIDNVVPIYGRANEEPILEALKEEPLPMRPAGQRLAPVIQVRIVVLVLNFCDSCYLSNPSRLATPMAPLFQQQQNLQLQEQQGFFPALFGFQAGPGQAYPEAPSPEQQHQAFLSRILLMLGSFVIMCLLLKNHGQLYGAKASAALPDV